MNIKKTTYQFIVARKSLHVFVRESDVSFFKRYCLGFHVISEVLWRVSKAAVRCSKSQSSEWLSDQRVFDLSFCLGQVEPPHLFRSQTVNISGEKAIMRYLTLLSTDMVCKAAVIWNNRFAAAVFIQMWIYNYTIHSTRNLWILFFTWRGLCDMEDFTMHFLLWIKCFNLIKNDSIHKQMDFKIV